MAFFNLSTALTCSCVRQNAASDTSRRDFLKYSSAAAVGLSAIGWQSLVRGESPNERIRIGVIGTGVRGKYLIGNLPQSARVTAICDCATSRIADTLEPKQQFSAILKSFRAGDALHCATYQDFRRMIDREKLDAVIIATPDHHHAQAAMLALDVYMKALIIGVFCIGESTTRRSSASAGAAFTRRLTRAAAPVWWTSRPENLCLIVWKSSGAGTAG